MGTNNPTREHIMAGHGAPPKDPSRRVRGGITQLKVIHAEPMPQPDLPTMHIEKDGELVERNWPAQTLLWWQMWGESPLAAEFTATDWDNLMDTAILHSRLWRGDIRVAPELRLRVANFGATPADRARLRITFAQADQIEDKAPPKTSTRVRRGPLKSTG